MSSAVQETWDALSGALATVAGLRVYDDPGAVVDPPAAVLGPPTLTWEGLAPTPTEATFTLALVAVADDRALQRLLDLLPRVAAAVDAVTDAVVRTATPGTFQVGGGTELPAYLIDIEVTL